MSTDEAGYIICFTVLAATVESLQPIVALGPTDLACILTWLGIACRMVEEVKEAVHVISSCYWRAFRAVRRVDMDTITVDSPSIKINQFTFSASDASYLIDRKKQELDEIYHKKAPKDTASKSH